MWWMGYGTLVVPVSPQMAKTDFFLLFRVMLFLLNQWNAFWLLELAIFFPRVTAVKCNEKKILRVFPNIHLLDKADK